MSRPVPPMCTLAQSGAALVWESGSRAGLIDLVAGEMTPGPNWDEAMVVAVSPTAAVVAVATDSAIDVRSRASEWESIATHDVAAAPFRMAVSDDGVVAAATSEDGPAPSSLLIIDDGERYEMSLGGLTPFTLLLDAEHGRVLVAGSSGPDSFHGGGNPFVALFGRDELDGRWSSQWSGTPPVDQPNGWVMPLAFGEIGVHTLDHFTILESDPSLDDFGSVVDTYGWDHLETVVSSPTGKWLAWFWRAEGDTALVRSVRLADAQVVEHPPLDGIGQFPVIAVDDDGVVTLADVLRPGDIRVRWLAHGNVSSEVSTLD